MKKINKIIINRFYKFKLNLIKKYKLSKIYKSKLDFKNDIKENDLSIIIFSTDRPLQLHMLLMSMIHYTSPSIDPYIIYSTSNEKFNNAYKEFFYENKNFFIMAINDNKKGFYKTLIDLLKNINSSKIIFFVDDIFFKNNLKWTEVSCYDCKKVIPSLRLSPNLNFCYTVNDVQNLPPLVNKDNKIFWYWHEGDYDWGYPLSLDGNIYDRKEILNLIISLEFDSPNTLELSMQVYRKEFLKRIGVCFLESIIVNNPINRVQADIPNLHGELHQDYLLEIWNEKKRINFFKYKGFINVSAHQELEYTYESEDI